MVYGTTRKEARSKVQALALRVIAEKTSSATKPPTIPK